MADAARNAARWQGQDRALDLLLADALGNVLMRPDEAWPLLEAHRSDDEAWRRVARMVALRGERWQDLEALEPMSDNPVREQLSIRARQDPGFVWAAAEEALRSCALLDSQPKVGRRSVDIAIPRDLPARIEAKGAFVAVGRGEVATDDDPLSGKGALRCKAKRWLDVDSLPERLPGGGATLAVDDGEGRTWIELRQDAEGLWVYAAQEPDRAERLLKVALGK